MKDRIRRRVHEWIHAVGIDYGAGASYEEINDIINRSIMETAKVLLEEHEE